MRRRTLLQLGIGASVLLTLVGGGVALLSPGLAAGRLTPRGRQLFAAVARAVLEGVVPPAGPESTRALDAHLDRLDQTIAGFPSHLKDELSLLVALLTHAPGRYAIAGLRADWAEARTTDVAAALQGMRVSAIATRRQIYQALRELTNAAYFADSPAWPVLGYPGPNPV